MALNNHGKGFTIPKTVSDCKKETFATFATFATFCFSRLLICRQKWVLRVVCRVSPGRIIRIIIVLSLTKYAFPRQIKPEILNLTIRRGQSKFSIVFIFVSCEEKGYYGVVSVGQLSFDCCSYCGRSRRMQGIDLPTLMKCMVAMIIQFTIKGG